MLGPWSPGRLALLVCLAVGMFAGTATAATRAQEAACTTETEPNDRPETAQVVAGDLCIQGDLTAVSDQDLFIWDIPPLDALHSWTLTIDGVPTTYTSIRLFRITSGTEVAPVVDPHELLRVDSSPDDRAPGVMADVRLAPGRYLVGISRGAPAAGGDPPSGAYTAHVERTGVVPAAGDVEPNDSAAAATPVVAAFTLSGDAGGSDDVFAWSIDAAAAERSWDVSALMPFAPQGSTSLSLAAIDGRVLASAPVGADGVAHIYDLRLPAGTYLVQLPAATGGEPYVLDGAVSTGGSSDPEPNDTPMTAVLLDPAAGPVRGRLAIDRDSDFYRLPVDAARAATQLDIALTWASGPPRQLCLYRDAAIVLQCRDGSTAAAVLSNLQLAPGNYTLEVLGDESPADGYQLAVTDVGPVRPDREVEPNDDGLTAAPFDPAVVMTGRAESGDNDYYRVTVTGDQPGIWRLDAVGTGLGLLEWTGRDGSVLATGDLSGDQTHGSLWDLYLVPGDHWVHVQANGGPYQLTLTPLGAVSGESEREPNNDVLTAQAIAVDGARVGRLPVPSDVDVYRFTLMADDHVAIHLDPPADAAIELELTSGSTTFASLREPVAGAPVSWDAQLWPGDYEIRLASRSRSVSPYTLRLERLDPFAAAAIAWPTPAPGASPGPAGAPSDPPPFRLTLRPARTEVAAWSGSGQRLTGDLVIASDRPESVQVDVDSATSDSRWSLEPASSRMMVPARGSISLPLVIQVPPDAPADVPVRVTLRAKAPDGAWTTAFADIVPRRDVALVEPSQAWPVPDALLGGLDVASLAVGGLPYGSSDPTREALLHDGVAVSGDGFSAQPVDGALVMSVDLAGEEPVMVAGTMVDPLAFDSQLQYAPRDFELLLSNDGAAWQGALTGELSPLGVEQSFVLPTPVAARFAQLRITSTYGSLMSGAPVSYAPLGEWKVVAAPGTVVSTGSLNIADPVRDGHIVWMDPQPPNDALAMGMLSEDPTPWLVSVARNRPARFIVGFHDDRAAQVTELQWVDPPGSTPGTRPAHVALDVSVDSPTGPWRSTGTWSLDRAEDGSVAPFVLPVPTWARFIRLTPDAPTDADSSWEMPSTLRVMERPTDDQYRSVLGEWGMGSPLGIHELLVPPTITVDDAATDADGAPETATPLAIGQVASGSVHRDQDEDWYLIRMPPGHDELTLDVGGSGYVDAVVELYDESGAPVPVTVSEGATAASARVRASVEPGATYRVRVIQPPISVVVTYDTSGSLGPYLSYTGQALRSFAAGVTPGQEAMRITPFEDRPLLDDWSDDPNALQGAVEGQVVHSFSSGVEAAILDAAKQLGNRVGTRAILVMTDGETLSYAMRDAMWGRIGSTRPLVFAVHVAGSGDPAGSTHLLQDLASTGGRYQYAVSHGDIDGAFDRAATLLRGPAPYSLSFTSTERPKLPGSVRVTTTTGSVPVIGGDVAVELVLDTSGSMTRRIGKRQRIADREVGAPRPRQRHPARGHPGGPPHVPGRRRRLRLGARGADGTARPGGDGGPHRPGAHRQGHQDPPRCDAPPGGQRPRRCPGSRGRGARHRRPGDLQGRSGGGGPGARRAGPRCPAQHRRLRHR